MHLNVLKLDIELPTPKRAHPTDAGLDLYARYPARLEPGDHTTVDTGVAVEIPPGHAGLILARSGWAKKHAVGLVNSPGLIDSDYRGELRVVLVNHGRERFSIARGDRVAQLVIVPVALPEPRPVDELGDTDRGEGGFGSSGR
ncbi:MAG: dUTP diphosphatase [Acidimicrobiia bacterium]|nr:dUTP diphosphatase [bacterium]MXZ06487.1 dUTP diphosphatase [Acidimicrobiia bacterium]MYH55735.1 dUTP diphosphatase [Acidimicrobiia bacterium]